MTKGGTAHVELRHPQTEAHLCQLAVLENFAEHGLYVKFSNEEAEQLEQEALALALAESTREAGMLREGDGQTRQASTLASTPYSKDEAERIAAALMHSEQQKAQPEQKAAPASKAPPKQSKSSGFKSLFKRKSELCR
ncbi:hypothetical protein WJX75_006260 [Coccomyxa subellipsoidea]|uniref:Uncharacterized protein n=1 Tax=Coccomyxa subellipsoidea TaxID=248742 RepID=A0ABR2Z464_9CHLO